MTLRSIDAAPGEEGFVNIDGTGFYVIPDVDRLAPFLMSIVSDSDHWMFVSSTGGLTAGRRDARTALFPYETDDRLHRGAGSAGPVTALRVTGTLWRPFHGTSGPEVRRSLFKSVVGNEVVFEEAHSGLGLVFKYRWAPSGRFGFARTASLVNLGEQTVEIEVMDGLRNLLPYGLEPGLYSRMSNLTNAYKRSELLDAATRFAVFSLEARIIDRPEPAEALLASTVWSTGLDGDLTLDPDALAAFVAEADVPESPLVTGRPGSYLLAATLELASGASRSWHIVADVAQSQPTTVERIGWLRAVDDPAAEIKASVRRGTDTLNGIMARSDALQRTGDRVATAHQFANVTYNVMRGGIPLDGYRIDGTDFAAFVHGRNRTVAERHRSWLDTLPEVLDRARLLAEIETGGDPQLMRLGLEYLPFGFSRRHGDPSRPWNTFSIRVRDDEGRPALHYEGNWRDIFQNWEALCLSFPQYLPGIIAVFVNASTPDGFNPYRITSDGIDWEVPDPEDPWSHIGYWGDHQIVYLERLIEMARRYLPGEVERLLAKRWFSYANVPYRIVSYDQMVRDPKETIQYDAGAAERAAERVDEAGSDGRLLWGTDRTVRLVTLLEKLLVPVLAKLSNYVPGGGIWMNTQRPEWNDANNALVGYGLSMVTLYQLRRHLDLLRSLAAEPGLEAVPMSIEVVDWLAAVTAVLRSHTGVAEEGLDEHRRKDIMDELGWAFGAYRSRVYASGFSGDMPVEPGAIVELCHHALLHLDDTIVRNRRGDGLYHSYNLVRFSGDGAAASIEHLPEMLEGQVAVLGAGVLGPEQRVELLDALFDSAMYREDQRSFMLYPQRRLPSFLDKNVIPPELVAPNPLFGALIEAGETSVVVVDDNGDHRFSAEFLKQADLEAALDRLATNGEWESLVAAHRAATVETYEEVFHHHGFTGRSGSMYGYEGIGSIYWHMVAKLLVAVQESVVEAEAGDADPETVARLVDRYWRVRAGLGFNKTAFEYGAFPTDPYSHTPAHAGAQQPGMTGQVKEELLTRLLETGVRVVDGRICFDAVLLRDQELLDTAQSWPVLDLDIESFTVDLEPGSLGTTLCQVPVVVSAAAGEPAIDVVYTDGTTTRIDGDRLDVATSAEVFARTGRIARIHAHVGLDAEG